MTLKFDWWPRAPLLCYFKLCASFCSHQSIQPELQPGNAQCGWKSAIFLSCVTLKFVINFLAATKQLYKWYFPSVCPSVCLSVCLSVTPFSPCSHHSIIMKFSEVITMVKSDVHAKGQRSKVKVTEVNTQLWGVDLQFEFTYGNEIMHTAESSIEEVPYCFSRSSVKFQGHTALKIVEYDPDWAFPDCNSSLNTQMATKWCTKLEIV